MDRPKIIREAKELNKEYNFFNTLPANIGSGIPLAIKDNICTKDIETTAGSEILKTYIPPYDATIITNLKKSGYAVLGKTSMDEFGFGTFSTNTYNIPKNPLDINRVCGGSSGGSAGYIAASKYAKFAIAVSTGGSISCPASFCGVVGLTPTYGLVSRYGLIDFSSSLDKIGVVAKTTKDAAKCLSIIASFDAKDSTSLKGKKQNFETFCGKNIKGMKIAVPKEFLASADLQIQIKIRDALEKLKKAGAEITEISLPMSHYALAAYYVIALCETSTNLAKFCGLRYGQSLKLEGNFNEYFSEVRGTYLGEEAKRRVVLGTLMRMIGYKSKYYTQALKVRQMIINEFKYIFKHYDLIAGPTMPIIAPRFEEIKALTPTQAYQIDILTVPPNLAGLPHISIPCGTVSDMPVGLQLIANHFQEGKLIQAGDYYERT